MGEETERSSVFRVFIQGSIEAVWREITKTDEVQKAFFNSKLNGDLKVGAPIRVTTPNGRYVSVVGEVLEFDPPRRYVHTFRFTAYDDPPCRVAYDLREVEGGVELTLTNENLPKGTKTARSMESGGRFIVNNIKRIVEKGNVSLLVRCAYRMLGPLTPLITPKRCKAANWPGT